MSDDNQQAHEPEARPAFKPGDVVHVRGSSHVKMAVESVSDTGDVNCLWMDMSRPARGVFMPATLSNLTAEGEHEARASAQYYEALRREAAEARARAAQDMTLEPPRHPLAAKYDLPRFFERYFPR